MSENANTERCDKPHYNDEPCHREKGHPGLCHHAMTGVPGREADMMRQVASLQSKATLLRDKLKDADALIAELRAERDAAIELLHLMYGQYEDGIDCHEIEDGESGAYIGRAVKLTTDEEDRIKAVIDRKDGEA